MKIAPLMRNKIRSQGDERLLIHFTYSLNGMSSDEQDDLNIFNAGEVIDMISEMRRNHLPPSESLNQIKMLINQSDDPVFVIENIPNVLSCTSEEFIQLYPLISERLVNDITVTSSIISVLSKFDYDNKAKLLVHGIVMKIIDQISKDDLPQLLKFMLSTTTKETAADVYRKIREILAIHEEESLYEAFEAGSKSILAQFFKHIDASESWCFFDFYLSILAISRPSLRSKIPSIIWSAIQINALSMTQLHEFFNMSSILKSSFPNLLLFFDLLIINCPKYIQKSATFPMTELIAILIEKYPQYSSTVLDKIISYLFSSQNYLSSIAIHALLNISEELLITQVNSLDEALSQTGLLSSTVLNTICTIIAKVTPESQKPMIMVSLPKRIFHHSHVVIESGISLAFHLIKEKDPEANEILEWVLQALKSTSLILKPNVLLRVIDLIDLRQDDTHLALIIDLYLDLINSFSLILPIKQKENVIGVGSSKAVNQISFNKITSTTQAVLCGELITRISQIASNHQKIDQRLSKAEFKFTHSVTTMYFSIPNDFDEIRTGQNINKSMINSKKFQKVVYLRAFMFPLISHLDPRKKYIRTLVDIIDQSDDYIEAVQLIKRVSFKDDSIFGFKFVCSCLLDTFFELPDDLSYLNYILKSLYHYFFEVHDHHQSTDDLINYILVEIDENLPFRVLNICNPLIKAYKNSKSEGMPSVTTLCIKNLGYALDFVSLCVSIREFHIDFDQDLLDKFELIDDVGVINRLLMIGYHLNVGTDALVQIAVQCIKRGLVSDLIENPIFFKIGIGDLDEVVKINKPGYNWRLIAYLSLLSSTFDDFEQQFSDILETIHFSELEMALVLADVLSIRIFEFEQYFDRSITICSNISSLLLIEDINCLQAILKLLKSVNTLKERVNYEEMAINNYARKLNRGIDELKIKKGGKLGQLLTNILVELGLMIENPNLEVKQTDDEPVTNPFALPGSSEDDFELEEDESDYSAIEDSIG